MALPQGVNFRGSLGYVTDGANEAFESCSNGGSPTYPHTTAQGNTIGSEGSSFPNADRNSAIDRRLAGIVYAGASTGLTWRIDLPSAGTYNIRLAAGDASFSNPSQWAIYDDLTKLSDITTGSISAASRWKDAQNVEYSDSTWPTSNNLKAFTFTSSICRVKSTNTAGNSVLSHFYVEAAGGASNTAINPGVGAVALTGYSPTIAQSANQLLTPGAGTLSITGYAPGIAQSANQSSTPGTGALTITGYAPVLAQSANQGVQPAAGVLTITGYAPAVTQQSTSPSLTPAAGQITITGYEPTVTQSGGAGRSRRKFQVETSRGMLEAATLDEVADIVRAEKRRPKAAPVEVKLDGIKVATPSLKPQIDYRAIEERMRAQVQAEMDDEEELLMMLL